MPTHKDLRTLLLCALYAFVLLFFLSPDSYLYDCLAHTDSAWFFMCGKAWMNGMTPYVDFADSKGPLLWLIYGIGYLLNKHSFVGVFWVSILFYTAVLYIVYKLSRLYLDAGSSALCTALLPLVIFFDWFHNEIRVEDFCYPFIMFSLYGLCRVIRQEEITKRSIFLVGGGIGVSFTACLLMKWNIAAMIGFVMLCTFILSFKRKVPRECLGGMVAGAVALALPFLIYFLAFADLGAMIKEYFLNTFQTMHGRTNALDVLTFDKQMLEKEKVTIALLIGLLLSLLKYRHFAWLLLCFCVFRIGLGKCSFYYYSVLTPFALFFIIAAVSFVFDKLPVLRRMVPVWCLLAAVVTIWNDTWLVRHVDQVYAPLRQQFYRAAYVMAQVEKPTIFLCNSSYDGPAVLVDALPSCRYWAGQFGAPPEMLAERERCLKAGVADFVISTDQDVEGSRQLFDDLKALGYVQYAEITDIWGVATLSLFGPPGLQLAPEDFYVSQWDIWLKRNIFGI